MSGGKEVKFTEKILLAFLVLSLVVSVFMMNNTLASPIKVYVDPPSIIDVTMTPGSQFTIDISVDYVEDLWSWQFELFYDPSVLNGVDFEMGPFLGSGGGHISGPWPDPEPEFNNTVGELPLTAAFLMETDPDVCADGGGVLASITFEVVGFGGSSITLGSDTGLVNVYGNWTVGGLRWDEDKEVWKIVKPSDLYPTDPRFLGHGYFDSRPQVGVEPPRVLGKEAGENFTIDVNVAYIEDVYSYSFSMNWNASLLNVTDVTEGEFLKREGRETSFTWESNNTAGQLDVDCTIVGEIEGVDGDGTLLTIRFTVTGEGTTSLSFYEPSFLDSLGEEIIVGTEYGIGQFNNVKFHNVAVTGVTPYPTEVEEGSGDIISIDVVVENTGSFHETNLTVSAYYDGTTIEASKTIAVLEKEANATLTFTWNTTGVEMGLYPIKANVTSVEEEADLEDNTFTYSRVAIAGRDITIFSATIPVDVIYKGTDLIITVKVRNKGTETETFNVTAYSDSTLIETETVESLPAGVSKTLQFTWDTSGVSVGNYTITVNATLVEDEKNPADNSYTVGGIEVLESVEPFPTELLLVAVGVIVVIVVAAVLLLRRRKPEET